jgi:hypothetical protein
MDTLIIVAPGLIAMVTPPGQMFCCSQVKSGAFPATYVLFAVPDTLYLSSFSKV